MPEPRHRPVSRLRVHGRRALRNAQRLLLSLLLVLFTVAAIAGSQKVLERDDARWLQSMTTGLDTAPACRSCSATGAGASCAASCSRPLPAPVQQLLRQLESRQRYIKAMPGGVAKIAAKKALPQRACGASIGCLG